MEKIRHIKLFKTYFTEFYVEQPKVVRDKLNDVFRLVESQRIIPRKFFRSLEGTDGLFEIRVEVNGCIYRVFCCFDEGALVVLFHGFQKKSQKTPPKEIRKAERIKKEYFNEKGK